MSSHSKSLSVEEIAKIQLALRKETEEKRKSQTIEWREKVSRQAVDCFLKEAVSRGESFSGKKVGLYAAIRPELDLSFLEKELLIKGAQIFYPRVLDSTQMEFAPICLAEKEKWKESPHRFKQPDSSIAAVSGEDLDWIFVPGVVYSRDQGARIGRGAGYYDRFLQKIPALRIALAFDIQLVNSFPTQPWDQNMNWICTETQNLRF